ncbi:MAG: glucohydrolase, partial [Actinomyces sp.]|nr:glucohydrolase [Actinomyces sp.]
GPAWEYDASTGQYYLHLFAREQPDLNWENPQVRDAVYEMMNWWLDRGVDGFRVDAIDVISKLPGLPDGGLPRPPFGVGLENGKFSPRHLVPGELADVLTRWQDTLGTRGWNALYLENHDQPRSVSRFGDPSRYWYESATALATTYFLQRGTPFIYQGQEIGMLGGDFTAAADFRDVESVS